MSRSAQHAVTTEHVREASFVRRRTRAERPTLAHSAVKKVIVSFYMANMLDALVKCQEAVLKAFAPADFTIAQVLTDKTHAAAIDDFLATTDYDLIVILDIDCVPLHAGAIEMLAVEAAQGKLAGCAQRANHIQNNGHLYVGPFCVAFTRSLWEQLGRPSFQPTARGDVGEELTYRWEAHNQPVHMIWPSFVEEPVWPLTSNTGFGFNTEYDQAFLHTFGSRYPDNQMKFVRRCLDLVGPDAVAIDVDSIEFGDHVTPKPHLAVPYVETPKHFWHRYTARYEQAFMAVGAVHNIVVFGVRDGSFIDWLARRFPVARIVGIDAAPRQATWPQSERIAYHHLDQSDPHAVRSMLARLNRVFDLVVESSSHLPRHRFLTLLEGLPHVRQGGLYIVEDVHTSYLASADLRQRGGAGVGNSLHILLAVQHLKICGLPFSDELSRRLAVQGAITPVALEQLFDQVKMLDLHKRTSLPERCYSCGSTAFDYQTLHCRCGVDLYDVADSMSFLIERA